MSRVRVVFLVFFSLLLFSSVGLASWDIVIDSVSPDPMVSGPTGAGSSYHETITVDYTIENTGSSSKTTDVELLVEFSDSFYYTEGVNTHTLDAGVSTSDSFSYGDGFNMTDDGSEEENREVMVDVDDYTAYDDYSVTVEVPPADHSSHSVVSHEVGSGDPIEVSWTFENTGPTDGYYETRIRSREVHESWPSVDEEDDVVDWRMVGSGSTESIDFSFSKTTGIYDLSMQSFSSGTGGSWDTSPVVVQEYMSWNLNVDDPIVADGVIVGDPADPAVSTVSATTTETSATLEGDLTDGGYGDFEEPIDVWFTWSGGGSSGQTSKESLSSTGTFSHEVTGLDSDTSYDYQAHAESSIADWSSHMNDDGGTQSFTTDKVEWDLTAGSTSGGVVVDPGEGTFTYTDGEAISLLAEADSGYDFLEWTGDTENITSPGSEDTSMVMNNHNSISAEFGEEVVADLTTDFSDPVYAGDSLTASLSCGYSDASKSFEWRNGDGDVMGTGSSYTVTNHGGSVNVVGNCIDSYGRSDSDDSGYSSVRGVLDVSTSGVYNGVSGGVDYGFNVDVTENYTGDSISPDSFTFDFNGETFGSVDVSDGSINVPTAGVEPGEYTVSYSGDKDLYDSDSGSLSFTVSPNPVFSHEVGWDMFMPSGFLNDSWIDSASSVDGVTESNGVLKLK